MGLFRGSPGAKALMALSGVGLIFYLVLHIAGHLGVFVSKDHYNSYAHIFHSTPLLLYGERIFIFALVAVHSATALWLVRKNRAARHVGYAERTCVRSTLFSRTMPITGLCLLVLFILHLLHFTVQNIGGATFAREVLADGTSRADTYLMVQSAFQKPIVVALYTVGILLFFAHLMHGMQSAWQSLGAGPFLRGRVLVLGLAIASLAVPFSFFLA